MDHNKFTPQEIYSIYGKQRQPNWQIQVYNTVESSPQVINAIGAKPMIQKCTHVVNNKYPNPKIMKKRLKDWAWDLKPTYWHHQSLLFWRSIGCPLCPSPSETNFLCTQQS